MSTAIPLVATTGGYALGWGTTIPKEPYVPNVTPGDWKSIFEHEAEWKKTMADLEAKQGMLVVATAQEAADRVEKTPGAITTSTINLIVTEKRAMKPLRIDGVAPSSKNVADGSYHYVKPVIIVTTPKAPPTVQSFVAFVRSPAGRDILVRTGHVPLTPPR